MIEQENESLARAQLPYRAEYCKTSRANCKKCCKIMQEDDLKLASMSKSRFHDGFDAVYYHVKCFFQTKRPSSVAEIRHFETLRYEDQKMIEEAVETKGLSILGIPSNGDINHNQPTTKRSTKRSKLAEDITENTESTGLTLCNYEDFMVEYAKSNRSTCNLCAQIIEKREVRLGKLDYEADTAWRGGPVPRWFHMECFSKSLDQLGFYGNVNKIKGFEDLDEEDQKLVLGKVKPIKKPALTKSRAKKIKPDPDSKELCKENNLFKNDADEERLLREQSDKFFDLRAEVNEVKRKDLELLLSHMNQKPSFKNTSQLVDAATDVLMFGPLDKCPQCNQFGGMVLRGGGYICTLGANEWEPCTYEARVPKRNKVDIPEEFLEKYPYFVDYEFTGGHRLFSSAYYRAKEQKEAEINNTVQDGAPLDGLTIGVINWKGVEMDREKVKKKVIMLGGTIQTNLDKTLFVILTSKKQLKDEADTKVEVAKELNIPFAKPDFLFQLESKADVVPKLKQSLVAEWSGDLESRFAGMNVNRLKHNIKSRSAASLAKSIYKSGSVAPSQRLIVKDGTAVDPDSGYLQDGRVYRSSQGIYSVVLNSVDVSRDKNSFYKMQIIEHEHKKLYILFRSWGRIGSSVGGDTCTKYRQLKDAIQSFEFLFMEKTGNPFSSLIDKTFRRVHGLYNPIELDYDDPNKPAGGNDGYDLKYDEQSKLSKQVQDFICFLFDIQRMNKIMKEFELDAEKMPLGKLSQKQILEAMQVLKELEAALDVKSTKRTKSTRLIALTNKFYSLIPQSFGDGEVELINNLKQIDEKNKMLEGLSEIQVAYAMCISIDKSSNQLPVDQYYMQLKCTILHIEPSDHQYSFISDYINKTHAITHNNYKLKIEDIFKVTRDEDLKRFKQHKTKERALLWHGSRTTNFAGILKDGLRIAPKEAPTTGFMFGKGIYFADMSSKAANYCMTDPTNDTGLLLLCEVALGKMHLLHESVPELPKGLPKDCHSVKGVGKNCTNPKTHINIDDDVHVPIGTQKAVKGIKSQLLYNEYVVYEESQTMIRYIVRVKFDFKSFVTF